MSYADFASEYGDSDYGAAAAKMPAKAVRWKAAKRKRALVRLLKRLAQHQKRKKQGAAWQKRDATLRAKITAIRQADRAAAANPAQAAAVEAAPDVPDTDPDTATEPEVPQLPAVVVAPASLIPGVPNWALGVGALVVIVAAVALSQKRPPA